MSDSVVQLIPDAELGRRMLAAAEVLRKAVREQLKQELAYDEAGVRWLDQYIEAQHQRKVELTGRHQQAVGAYLGECVIRTLGGAWAMHQGSPLVRLGDGNGVFPLAWVEKHWRNGRDAGDTVLGKYGTTQRLMPRPPSAEQLRLKAYGARGGLRIFVPGAGGSWDLVQSFDGEQVRLGRTAWSGRGEVSVRLCDVRGFYVFDAAGMLLEAQGSADPAALPPQVVQALEAAAPRPRRAALVAAQAADPVMERALAQVRQKLAAIRKAPTPRTFEMMRAPNPPWMKESDGLCEIGRQQLRLLAEGEAVWAALIMANKLMFKPGREDCPGALVYSRDPWFDARPQELRAIAQQAGALKETKPDDPELRRVADLLTSEMDRGMDWKVPQAITAREVTGAAFMVFRKHIPRGVLQFGYFPILVHPQTPAVMIAPFETWPQELLALWQPGGTGRSLEEIRKLPEGLRVTHTPAVAAAVPGEDGKEFRWEFATRVEALRPGLSVVEFGAFTLIQGQWRFGTITGEPFTSKDFAEWYACPGAALEPGRGATDHRNWHRGNRLISRRVVWYYIARDAEGRRYRGEAELEQRGTLVPPESAAAPQKQAGGLAAVGRIFGKAAVEPLLRFDGVYRTRQQPGDENDQRHLYLRLYPDGAVLAAVSAEQPSELARWLSVHAKGKYSSGRYKLGGEELRIEIPQSSDAIVFSGSVERNRLLLESNRLTGGKRARDEFLFMGWRP